MNIAQDISALAVNHEGAPALDCAIRRRNDAREGDSVPAVLKVAPHIGFDQQIFSSNATGTLIVARSYYFEILGAATIT
ncbi:hypothetical protein VSR68_22425 [Paraburkholderia phymatum]|uniref:hypothetical protein n=1 Tax=Paraburkholderia phymatum TaxID=148447 RepID=UPI003171B435